jgi:Ca-activated chloride channel family protein
MPSHFSFREENHARWVAAIVLAFAAVYSQEGRRAPAPTAQSNLRVDVSLAVIPVSVTDPLGVPVLGLPRERFHLFEDGVEQTIAFLASEDRPVSVCLVFDLSASMRDKVRTASEAVTHLLQSFDQAGDEFGLILFNERPWVAVPFTGNSRLIVEILRRARPLGRTALLDALHLARTQMRMARNGRRVIVILSDGGDNHSRSTRSATRREMQESDVQVYAMSVRRSQSETPSRLAPEELNGPMLLNDIAADTGGRHVELTRPDDLAATCAEIALQLHSQYVLGYSPSVHDGRSHSIQITLTGAETGPLRVLHRRELYTPVY